MATVDRSVKRGRAVTVMVAMVLMGGIAVGAGSPSAASPSGSVSQADAHRSVEQRTAQPPAPPADVVVGEADAALEASPLLIAPAGPYGDGQVVLVGGSGFPTQAMARVVECVPTVGDECLTGGHASSGVELAWWPTSKGGGLLVAVRLTRFVRGVDCTSTDGVCELRVIFDSAVGVVSTARLAFDAAIAPRPPPSVTVTPSTSLRDGDELLVTGRHFLPNTDIIVQQCLTDLGRCRGLVPAMADRDGSMVADFTVGRRVWGMDCAVEDCVLFAINESGGDRVVTPLEFDASVPPPPEPTLTVTPSTDLVDFQQVRVEAEHLGEAFVSLQQCDAGGLFCRPSFDGQTPVSSLSTTVEVRRILQGPEGGYDCATEPDGCILRLSADGEYEFTLDQTLAFDPDGPVPAAVLARIVAGSRLVDGDLVRVLGSGFRPGTGVSVAECPGDPPISFDPSSPGDCTWLRRNSVLPNDDGEVDHRLRVHRRLEAADGTVRDCARSRCTLLLIGLDSRAVLRLHFSRRGPSRPSFPAQLPCVSWPTSSWPTGPLPDGVDRSVMESIAREALVEGSSTNSILVVHGGRLVFERYREGVDADTTLSSFSIAKSMTSTIIGMLIEDGKLELDGPAPVPEWSDPADPRHSISIRNLLNMSSGLQWNEDYTDPSSDAIQMLSGSGAGDMAHFAAARGLANEPGTFFAYSTGDTMILAGIIARTVGTGATLDAYLHEHLFDPIGMGPMRLGFDGSGVWVGGAQADTTAQSFARFGLLYLRGGSWDGSKVLADGWAEYARTPAPTATEYGAQFWLDDAMPGAFHAEGVLGQTIEIVPELDLVIVVNSSGGFGTDIDGIIDEFAGASPPGCGTMTAADDVKRLRAGRTVALRVLANDRSIGGRVDRRRMSLIQMPQAGSARVRGRTILYRAPRRSSGRTETLTYEVCNRRGDCDEAKVTIRIE